MVDCVVMADLGEQRKLFGRAIAVAEGLEGELAPVVGQDLLDLERVKLQTAPQKVSGCGSISVLIDTQNEQARGPVNSDIAVGLLAAESGQVETIDMKIAGAILLEDADLPGGLLLFLGSSVAAVSFEQTMETRTAQMRHQWRHLIEEIIERHLARLAQPQEQRFFLFLESVVDCVGTARAVKAVLSVLPCVNRGD